MAEVPSTTKHPKLYFQDGNIILRVANQSYKSESQTENDMEVDAIKPLSTTSAGHTLFRVHRGVLSLHSGTFASMFGIPQPNERGVIDGCDVVDLYDSVADIEKLLSVIYGVGPQYKRLHQDSFNYYSPLIPLADKYEMTDIRKTYLDRIIEGWPTDLKEWDAFREELRNLNQSLMVTDPVTNVNSQSTFLDSVLVRATAFLRFAEDNSLRNLLPGAYYHLSRISNHEFEDDMDLLKFLMYGGLKADYSQLRFSHLEKLYVGKNQLRRTFANLVAFPWKYVKWSRPFHHFDVVPLIRGAEIIDHETESRPLDCDPRGWWTSHMFSFVVAIETTSEGDVLKDLVTLGVLFKKIPIDVKDLLCEFCQADIERSFADMRSFIWGKIPSCFHLDS